MVFSLFVFRDLPARIGIRRNQTPRVRMIRTVVVLASLLWIAVVPTAALSANASPRVPGIRVGYIGDSLVQGNNLAAPDGLSITALANREITWARALYPYFDIDT